MDDAVFHRHDYAQAMVRQLLQPGPLDAGVRSGVFISGIRRIGKTTFIRQDLMPALVGMGALPLYLDLWSDRARAPGTLLVEAVRSALVDLERPSSGLLGQLRRVKGVDFGAAGFKFGFQLESLGTAQGATLDQAFVELVRQSQGDVVLIIDEVQQALTTKDGEDMLFALKAARDRVNTATDLPGRLLIIGTGSHKSLVTDMATRRSQAFAGAHTASFAPLGRDFVDWFLQRVAAGGFVAPSLDVAWQGFQSLVHRPEELTKAVLQLQSEVAAGRDADAVFPVICTTLASAAAGVEIQGIEDAGELAVLAFSRIAGGQSRGLFGADTLAWCAARLGREVSPNDMNQAIDKLVAGNYILRKGHGSFAVADPFVEQVWMQQQAMRQALDAPRSPPGNA